MFIYKFFQILLWLPSKIFLPTRVIGKKSLVKTGAIFVCNHQSMLDIPILSLNIFRMQHYLTKSEFFKNGKKSFFSKFGAIPIDREKPELSSIKQCLCILKSDKVLTIFPEGTRKNKYPLEHYKGGTAMFAVKSNKPVIPMWIVKKPGLFKFNTLKIGKPLNFSELQKTDANYIKQVDEMIYLSLKQLSVNTKKPNKKNLFLI